MRAEDQTQWGHIEVVQRWRFKALNAYIKKEISQR